MTTVTDLDTARTNNQLFSKIADLQRAMAALDSHGHKILAVSINSRIPVINIALNPKADPKNQQQAEIKFAGKVIAIVSWQQKTNLNQGAIS